MNILAGISGLKLRLIDRFVTYNLQTCRFSLHKTLTNGMETCG